MWVLYVTNTRKGYQFASSTYMTSQNSHSQEQPQNFAQFIGTGTQILPSSSHPHGSGGSRSVFYGGIEREACAQDLRQRERRSKRRG